ncbi:MAG TPA: DNA cytosine methyltransferase [Candidatus Latescibacteria bacterium]|nr:DNA cytosine methyltransferase [Candidatus Latescibacterota bacterium]
MTYATVCSGIEAPSVAWHPLGWQPVFFSEIEKFPCAVLSHHYPSVPNYGDMTEYEKWPNHAIDVICGGTPCQSFSIAGLRKGISDPRGNLALVYLGVIDKYRPTWVVWENVPGVLSSGRGRDLWSFLSGLVQLGYSYCFRILDAQYFGVPQRRRRIFVIGHLGNWTYPAAVLLERKSMCGHNPAKRKAGEGVAGTFKSRARSCGFGQDIDLAAGGYMQVANSLGSRGNRSHTELDGNGAHVCSSVSSKWSKGTGGPSVDECQNLVTWNPQTGGDCRYGFSDKPNLQAHQIPAVGIRRLMPVECERLMGLPDFYTAVPYRNKPACDGPRYKALGNSMAVPVVRWIGERIQQVEKIKNGR